MGRIMLLLEALVYNIIAIIVPCIKLYERKERAVAGGSGKVLLWNGFCAINLLSSIISSYYAIRLGHRTSVDRDGIIMGSTILSSLALVLFDFDGGIDNKDSSSNYDAFIFVGLVVLSGFVFASLSTHAALSSCSTSNVTASSSTTTNTAATAADISPVCYFLRKYHLSLFFWTTVHAFPLVMVDIAIITIIFLFPQSLVELENFGRTIIIYHGIIILQCFLSKQYQEIDAKNVPNNNDSVNHCTSLKNMARNVVTIGEWYLLSTLLSFLFVDFCHGLASSSSTSSFPRPSHWIVSQSGILGCILGCIAATTISSSSSSGKYLRQRSSFIRILLHMLIIIVFTFTWVELALGQLLKYHKKHASEPSMCSSDTFYTYFNASNIIIQKIFWNIQSTQNLPLHLKWIIIFLLTSDDVEVLPLLLRSTSVASDTPSNCPLQPFILNNSGAALMRGWWLIYWAFVLFVTLPIAIVLAQYLLLFKQKHKIHNLVSTGRKLFHFIAVLLFGPVTWYAPSLMTLSYAVALALLVLLESVRYELSVSTSRNLDSDRIFANEVVADTTGKIAAATNISATMKRYNKEVKKMKGSLSMNEFYYAFLDEKDDEEGASLVITHIALLLGCALPQWIATGIASYDGSIKSNGNMLLSLLPYCGILILGVGDSFGAIVGSSRFGRTRWPGSKRTLEGSASMLLSMLLFVGVFYYFSNVPSEQPKKFILCVLSLFLVTLLEASTMQIDNICLPIFGATLLLLFGKNNNNNT